MVTIRDPILTGTTSACAENTGTHGEFPRAAGNYLRMRGEYSITRKLCKLPWELPPHARRIRISPEDPTKHQGTTSACAENTLFGPAASSPSRNYLRMRGEYPCKNCTNVCPRELPPHARRIPVDSAKAGHGGGTTSACAENTVTHATQPLDGWNYLRMRGEYAKVRIRYNDSRELPPHARRILSSWARVTETSGTTSACAENTLHLSFYHTWCGNYLRMRGEY